MITLRPYQIEIINKTRESMRTHKSVCVVAPTGAGKTAIGCELIRLSRAKDKTCFFIVHRRELVEQTAREFDKCGIDYGYIAAKFPYSPNKRIYICMIQSLSARINKLEIFPDLIVADEFHHAISKSWLKVLRYYEAYIIGLTATPERLDGKGLNIIADDLIMVVDTPQLISDGYLCDYRIFAPSVPDMSGIKKSMGDYDRASTADKMKSKSIVGDVVSHYRKLSDGKQAVVFAVNVNHSKIMVDAFIQAGYSAAHIDSDTLDLDRKNTVEDFRNGKIQILSNVELIGEGFDLPSINTVILARPTQSLAMHRQQVGRALRPCPGKTHAIILDHAGNTLRHGLPDDIIEWSLDGNAEKRTKAKNKEEEKDIAIKRCPECFAIVKGYISECPECGKKFEVKSVKISVTDEELKEIDVVKIREDKLKKEYNVLVHVARKRGYGYPAKWAQKIIEEKRIKQIAKEQE